MIELYLSKSKNKSTSIKRYIQTFKDFLHFLHFNCESPEYEQNKSPENATLMAFKYQTVCQEIDVFLVGIKKGMK